MLTENQRAVVDLTRVFNLQFGYASGGPCHLVSSDFVMQDSSIDVCLKAVEEAEDEGHYWTVDELNVMKTYLLALKAIPEADRETHDMEGDGPGAELLDVLYEEC